MKVNSKLSMSDNQPIDTMKADYCVVVWAVNLSEQTLFDLPLRRFDLTNDRCPTVIICSVRKTLQHVCVCH